MANVIEYVFSLQDKISAKVGNITITSDRMLGKFADLQRKTNEVNKTFSETGRSLGSLKERIHLLQAEREWLPADNIEGIRAYNREIRSLSREVNKLEGLQGRNFAKWSKEAFAALPGSNLISNPLVAATTVLGFSGKQAMSLDEGMAKINITAQLDESGLNDLKNKIKDIAVKNKTEIALAPVGFEKILSQTGDVNLSLDIFNETLRGSKAGFVDLDTVSSALAQSLSIIGKENTNAREVLDTFFAAKKVGAGEFADFARYMPNLIAGASNLGINFKQVAGTFAYMTGKGQSAERAAVLMENAFSVLGKSNIREKMEKAGIKVFDKTGKIRSVVDIFTDLNTVLHGMSDAKKANVLESFGLVDKEAKNAFAILTSDVGKLAASMDEVTNSSGETDKALQYSRNSMQRLSEVWASFKNTGTQLGSVLLPVINGGLIILSGVFMKLNTIIEGVTKGLSWFMDKLSQGNPLIVGLTASVGFLTTALLVNYAVTQKAAMATTLKTAIDSIAAGGIWLLTQAQWALNAAFIASPIGWITIVIGALSAGVVYCWQQFEGFRQVIMGMWSVLKEFGQVLIDAVLTPFKQVLNGISGITKAIVSLMKGDFEEAATQAKNGFKDIAGGITSANPLMIGYEVYQKGDWQKAWVKGKQEGSQSWNASKNKTMPQPSPQELPISTPDVPGTSVKYDPNLFKKKNKKKTILDLNDKPKDRKASADYMAAVKKLTPVYIPLQKTSPNAATPTNQVVSPLKNIATPTNQVTSLPKSDNSSSAKVDDSKQIYPTQTPLEDIMLNVRRIAAAVIVPATIAVATPSSAYSMPSNTDKTEVSNYQGYTDSNRSVPTLRVEKFCEQIVINVQNIDEKGTETIRREIEAVLTEIIEHYNS